MEPSVTPNIVPSIGLGVRGGFRGRGPGGGGRGSYDRGRGRFMPGRGVFVGAMGRGGVMSMGAPPPPQGMIMSGRGMRMGGPPMFSMRGGFLPRNGGQVRGGRHPMYSQSKQHSGSENNKTVSPIANAVSQSNVAEASAIPTTGIMSGAAPSVNKATTVCENVGVNPQTDLVKHTSGPKSSVANGNVNTGPQLFSRSNRTRGGHYFRGVSNGRAGGFNHKPISSTYEGYGSHDQNQINARRGNVVRGRGGYGQNIQRPVVNQQHTTNSQSNSLVAHKRGAPTGPGSKRGRYEGTPYSPRPMPPNYHHSQQSNPALQIPPHSGYSMGQTHQNQAPLAQQTSHSGYTSHETTQIDPYSQQYNAPPTQTNYNGYNQSSTYATPQGLSSSNAYASHSAPEYDQSQYQTYNYGSQQDARYQGYSQDYSQQYGIPSMDYSQTQNDYSQHQMTNSTMYDDRNFAGYDANYQQNYSNQAGYY